jgi:hypothetical protein
LENNSWKKYPGYHPEGGSTAFASAGVSKLFGTGAITDATEAGEVTGGSATAERLAVEDGATL